MGETDAAARRTLLTLGIKAFEETELADRVRRCEAEDGTVYRYVRFDDAAYVAACEPAGANVVLPGFLDGCAVRGIGAFALSNLLGVRRIELPASASDVGHLALSNCLDLRDVSFASHGARFDHSWLQGCPHIERLALPGMLSEVTAGSVDFPCLRELAIGAGTRSLAPLSLRKASRLERIAIDAANPSLTTDGFAIFRDEGRVLVAMAVHVPRYVVPRGVIAIGEKAFAYDHTLERVSLPEGLKAIAPFAFFESGLASCALPASVASVGEKAFAQCRSLVRIDLNEGLEALGDEAFARTGIEALSLPASLRKIGAGIVSDTPVRASGEAPTFAIASENPRFLFDGNGGIYEREGGELALIALIGDAADYKVLSGTALVAPRAAHKNAYVQTLSLPNGLRAIGERAFASCASLRSVSTPSTLERIDAEAFAGTSLERIDLPAGLSVLGTLALGARGPQRKDGRPALADLRVDPANEKLFLESNMLFRRLGDGTLSIVLYLGADPVIAIPRSVSVVEPYAFSGVKGVRELRLHDGIRVIGGHAMGFADAPEQVRFDFRSPVQGRASLTTWLPDHPRSALGFSLALGGPSLDVCEYCRSSDAMMLRFGAVFERARSAVERLSDPLFLAEEYKRFYEDFLDRRLYEVCASFASANFARGFDLLADLGYITQDNITRVIDAVSEAGGVAMTGHMLEMKRRRFGGSRLDFDL